MDAILLIHPDPVLRDKLTLILQDSGFHVVGVSGGQEALADISTVWPDLILLAEGNLCVRIREICWTPIVILGQEQDEAALDQLMSNVESMGLKNVERLDLLGKSRIGLDNESVDVVLLYDVLHYYYFPKEEDRRQLLREVYRVLKPYGLLSVYPTHLESHMEPKLDDVKREIEESNFRKQDEFNGMIMIHDDNVEEGTIINFKKGEVTAW